MNAIRKSPNAEGHLLLAEGEYGKSPDGTWYVRPPGCHVGSLEKHKVTEHDDGTITVSPSILIDYSYGDPPVRISWHGYLERGNWRQC